MSHRHWFGNDKTSFEVSSGNGSHYHTLSNGAYLSPASDGSEHAHRFSNTNQSTSGPF